MTSTERIRPRLALASVDPLLAAARREAPRLARALGIPVRTSVPRSFTRQEAAEHEAAHVVVGLALRLQPVFAVAAPFARHDGGNRAMFCLALGNSRTCAIVAVAGMVWDRSSWLGYSDAAMLVASIATPGVVADGPTLLRQSCAAARRLLRRHAGAVRAVADVLVKAQGAWVQGDTLVRTAFRGSPALRHAARHRARGGACRLAWKLARVADGSPDLQLFGVARLVEMAKPKEQAPAVWSPSAAREHARALLCHFLTDDGDTPPIDFERRVQGLRDLLRIDRAFDTAVTFAAALGKLGLT